MGLNLMSARVNVVGKSVHDEMIIDGRNILAEEFQNDPSYSTTMYVWESGTDEGYDSRFANVRIYSRKYSSLNGNYQKFVTLYDNPIYIGDYLHDTADDTFWVVMESFDVDGIQREGKMVQCNYQLKWQQADGTIIKRWANIVSASKYNVGVDSNNVMQLSANNFTILIRSDDAGITLEGQKVFIDIQEENPYKVFNITRSDDVLFNSGNMGGLLSYIADKTEIDLSKDRPDLRICNYHSKDTFFDKEENGNDNDKDTTLDLQFKILGGNLLKVGYPRTFTVVSNQDDSLDTSGYEWEVSADFDINYEIDGNTIKLWVDDESAIDSTFTLSVKHNTVNDVSFDTVITVTDMF